MTNITMNLLFTGLFLLGSLEAFAQDGPNLKVSDIKTNEDTSVIIKKGANTSFGPEFEIVSGTSEISGDPILGAKESYASWKAACAEWKRETRELNKENQVLAMGCNTPIRGQENGMQVYRSTGTYKLKVRIRDAQSAR